MKKRLLQLLSLVMVLVCLTACGKETGSAGSADASGNGETVSGTTADNTEDSLLAENEPTPAPETTPTPIAPPSEEKQAFYDTLLADRDIPIISIYTRDRAEVLSLEDYVDCVVDVINCESAYAMEEVPAGIRVRGNSSAYYGDVEKIREFKAPYRIKFEEKQSMLGLNDGAECKSWVLLKTDHHLIANDIALRMGRAILGDHAYCSDSIFVHVFINEEFHGVYLLCEQNQVNENRVDITEPEEDYRGTDIGYYMEIDNYVWNEPDSIYFTHTYADGSITDIEGVTRSFAPAEYSLKNDVTDDAQPEFIGRYMNNLFTALYEACVNDTYWALDENGELIPSDYTSSYEVADALLDLESVVNMYILHEIVHSYDCGEGSFYMCIDFSPESQCKKLQFTSPWDFNWAYEGEPTEQYYAGAFCSQEFMESAGDRSNPWFVLLMTEDWFVDMVSEKWTALHNAGALEACLATEEEYLLTYEQDMLYAQEDALENAYALLEWVRTRVAWLDEEWVKE